MSFSSSIIYILSHEVVVLEVMEFEGAQLHLGSELDVCLVGVVVAELLELLLSHTRCRLGGHQLLVLPSLVAELRDDLDQLALHELGALELFDVHLLLLAVALLQQVAEDLGYLLGDEWAGPGEDVHKIRQHERVGACCELHKVCLAVLS